MRDGDALAFALRNLQRHGLRSALIILAMAVGVMAIVSLTALGEGARRFVVGEFASLGSKILIIVPGKNDTTGGAPPMTGEVSRDLTLRDAQALLRDPLIQRVAPVILGASNFSHGNREREVTVVGTSKPFAGIRSLQMARGSFIPAMDLDRTAPVVVIGKRVVEELFGNGSVVGELVRIGDRRFRVIGVIGSGGQSLGLNMDELVVIPVASAQNLFNRLSMFRILAQVRSQDQMEQARQRIITILRQRHEGEEDVTVISQDAVLSTFDKLFTALTAALGGIAAISILVAGILIMNVTLVAVAQRTGEIGLMKALGATAANVRNLILIEAVLLSLAGAGSGLIGGYALVRASIMVYPDFPLAVPTWAPGSALAVALTAGIVFALMPARKAARLDPVQALTRHA